MLINLEIGFKMTKIPNKSSLVHRLKLVEGIEQRTRSHFPEPGGGTVPSVHFLKLFPQSPGQIPWHHLKEMPEGDVDIVSATTRSD